MTAAVRDEFEAVTVRHRRELHVHCYRMLASFEEAEDAVQETFLRAWRGRDGLRAGPSARAWLYRIATNVCIDARRRRARPVGTGPAEIPWLQPYPDALLDEVAAGGAGPDDAAVERETIELVFLAALQLLPPRQRAALIARDVLGWSAEETAGLLEASVPAANSALQRARATMGEHLPERRSRWSAGAPTAEERALGPDRDGDWRLLATSANRLPAAASYLRRPGDTRFRGFKLDVIRIADGRIAEITTFGPSLLPSFGLPDVLPDG